MRTVMRVVACGLILVLVVGGGLPAAMPRQGVAPNVLAWLPAEMVGFVHLRGEGLWNNPVVKDVLGQLPPGPAGELERAMGTMSRAIGADLRAIRTATVCVRRVDVRQQKFSYAFLLTGERPFQGEAFSKTIEGKERRTVEHDGVELLQGMMVGRDILYLGRPEPSVLVYGDLNTVRAVLDARKQRGAGGPLAAAVAEAGKHDVSMVMQLPDALREDLTELAARLTGPTPRFQRTDDAPPGAAELPEPPSATRLMSTFVVETILDVKQLRLFVDTKPDLRVDLALECRGEASARRFFRALNAGALGLELAGESARQTLEQVRSAPAGAAAMVKKLQRAASESQTTLEGRTVRFGLELPGFSADFGGLMGKSVSKVMAARDRMQRQSQLRQLALAMHNYHVDYNKLPAQAVYSKGAAKKPLLSWRVTLLSYLEADHLYQQFKLDEPWDSEHNKKLIPQMPAIFRVAGAPNPGEGKTYFQVFVAPEKPPSGKQDRFAPIFRLGGLQTTLGRITVQDGTSNTILAAEGSEAVVWTKPDDLLIEHDGAPLPKLGCVPDEEWFDAVFADGSVRRIRRSLPNRARYESLLRQLIGVNDAQNEDAGEIIE